MTSGTLVELAIWDAISGVKTPTLFTAGNSVLKPATNEFVKLLAL